MKVNRIAHPTICDAVRPCTVVATQSISILQLCIYVMKYMFTKYAFHVAARNASEYENAAHSENGNNSLEDVRVPRCECTTNIISKIKYMNVSECCVCVYGANGRPEPHQKCFNNNNNRPWI